MIASARCVFLLVLVLVLAASTTAFAQQSQECVSTIPRNIQAGILTDAIVALLQVSATFRAQCERIAAVRSAHVDLAIAQPLGGARAQTTLTHYEAGALRAYVTIAFGQDYDELIAHEFEHIIEQLDGVDLRAEALEGRAWLIETNVFETRRATEAGRRVRRERNLSEAHAAVGIHHELR
jgi:hypothetical protein